MKKIINLLLIKLDVSSILSLKDNSLFNLKLIILYNQNAYNKEAY